MAGGMDMEGNYPVLLGTKNMGSVQVEKQGLYWQFSSRCDLSGEVMYDLVACAGDQRIKIGLLSPYRGKYTLQAKLPVKRFTQEIPHFCLQARHEATNDGFVPLKPEMPFAYIHRLEEAYLAVKQGQIGLVIPVKK